MKNALKYTLRKLGFLLILAALIYAPFGVMAYKSATTTDPYILMAREIEAFESGTVDVVNLKGTDTPDLPNAVSILITIEDFPSWSVRKEHNNFKVHVLGIIGDYGYEGALMFLGWDYPAKEMRIQGVFVCPELRASFCTWEYGTGQRVDPQHIKWPGIGKP